MDGSCATHTSSPPSRGRRSAAAWNTCGRVLGASWHEISPGRSLRPTGWWQPRPGTCTCPLRSAALRRRAGRSRPSHSICRRIFDDPPDSSSPGWCSWSPELLGLLLHLLVCPLLGLALSRPLQVQRMVAGRIAVGEPVLWWNAPDTTLWHGQGGWHTENGPTASLWV